MGALVGVLNWAPGRPATQSNFTCVTLAREFLPSTCPGCLNVFIAWIRPDPVNPEAPAWDSPSRNTSCGRTVDPYGRKANSGMEARLCLPCPRHKLWIQPHVRVV